MKKIKIIAIVGILMLMITLFAGCTGEQEEEQPICRVTKVNGYWKDNGDWYWHDWIYCVNVIVRNDGVRGNVKVWASVTQNGQTYTNVQTVTINENGQAMITARFDEVSSSYGVNYRGWVTS